MKKDGAKAISSVERAKRRQGLGWRKWVWGKVQLGFGTGARVNIVKRSGRQSR